MGFVEEKFKEAGLLSKGYDKEDVDRFISKLTKEMAEKLELFQNEIKLRDEIIDNTKIELIQKIKENKRLNEERSGVFHTLSVVEKEMEDIKKQKEIEISIMLNKLKTEAKEESEKISTEIMEKAEREIFEKRKQLRKLSLEIEKKYETLKEMKQLKDKLNDEISILSKNKEILKDNNLSLKEELEQTQKSVDLLKSNQDYHMKRVKELIFEEKKVQENIVRIKEAYLQFEKKIK